MPTVTFSGCDPDDDLRAVLDQLLATGERVVVDGGVVLTSASAKRLANRARQRKFRESRRVTPNAPEGVTRNAGEAEISLVDSPGYNKPSANAEGVCYPENGNASNASPVTPLASVTRNGSPHALPAQTPEQRAANLAEIQALRERLLKGEL